MLGHKSAAMTLDTYSDLFPDDLDAVAAKPDEAVRALDVGSSGRAPPDPHIVCEPKAFDLGKWGGAAGNRTPDLFDANEARYQLRYSPRTADPSASRPQR